MSVSPGQVQGTQQVGQVAAVAQQQDGESHLPDGQQRGHRFRWRHAGQFDDQGEVRAGHQPRDEGDPSTIATAPALKGEDAPHDDEGGHHGDVDQEDIHFFPPSQAFRSTVRTTSMNLCPAVTVTAAPMKADTADASR